MFRRKCGLNRKKRLMLVFAAGPRSRDVVDRPPGLTRQPWSPAIGLGSSRSTEKYRESFKTKICTGVPFFADVTRMLGQSSGIKPAKKKTLPPRVGRMRRAATANPKAAHGTYPMLYCLAQKRTVIESNLAQ